ncbi:MAG: hypothetical protein ACXVGC_00135 [Mycobacteriaceae bacterium]
MSSFDADYQGIGELLKSQMIFDALYTRGEAVRAMAEATAPYDQHDKTHFRDSFHVAKPGVDEDTGRERIVPDGHDRVVVTVYNDDDAAIPIETGTSHTPAHRTLSKALDAAGN